MKEKVIYYSDELNDEFSGIKRNTIKIDEKFKYEHKNIFWKIASFIVYRLIMIPFAFIYDKIKFRHKIINKKVLKQVKNKGYFIYGNHTLMDGDAFIPNIVNFPKKTYVVVHPDNISQTFGKTFILLNGAMPLPDTLGATRNFTNAMKNYLDKGNVIQIYPEAHIWPYYTKIRPFKETSFRYPVKFNAPVYCLTNTFVKRKHSKKPQVITFVDGPFYVNGNLTQKEQEKELRDKVYDAMQNRAKNSNFEFIKYIKNENTGEKND